MRTRFVHTGAKRRCPKCGHTVDVVIDEQEDKRERPQHLSRHFGPTPGFCSTSLSAIIPEGA